VADPIITLTTDYGTNDHLAGVLKGVILNILPNATIVDITHQVLPFDVLDGALTIGASYPYFPARTVHLVVVDPGVGGDRRPIVVSADNQYFVAPDNGVLSIVYERDPNAVVRHITAEHYFLAPLSKTFHGRDVFAPVAARLAKTLQIESLGEVISDFVRFTLPQAKQNGTTLKGIVLRVDAFGNLMTNFRAEDLPQSALEKGNVRLNVSGKQVERLVPTFAAGAPGEPVAVLGSNGFLEIAVNKGNAARALGASRGVEVTLEVA
jgi:S-adenosylmethionine hydrolase